jgi:hypothetical protein
MSLGLKERSESYFVGVMARRPDKQQNNRSGRSLITYSAFGNCYETSKGSGSMVGKPRSRIPSTLEELRGKIAYTLRATAHHGSSLRAQAAGE